MYLVDYKKMRNVSDSLYYYDIGYSLSVSNKMIVPTRDMPICKAVITNPMRNFMEIWAVTGWAGEVYIFQGLHENFSRVIPNLSIYDVNKQIDKIINKSNYDNDKCDFYFDVTQEDIVNFTEWQRRCTRTLLQEMYYKSYPAVE